MSQGVLICGVGGQGVLLASEVVAHAAIAAQLDAKKSEVHGMAQRGGSVESHVRFGGQVASPLIEVGVADVLVGCEAMESLRSLHYLRAGGVALVSTYRAVPPSVREDQYPAGIEEKLSEVAGRVISVPSVEMAIELGNPRVANVILLGALAGLVDLPDEAWEAALATCVPAKALDVNRQAFERGRALLG